jgi:hypothetical protein
MARAIRLQVADPGGIAEMLRRDGWKLEEMPSSKGWYVAMTPTGELWMDNQMNYLKHCVPLVFLERVPGQEKTYRALAYLPAIRWPQAPLGEDIMDELVGVFAANGLTVVR